MPWSLSGNIRGPQGPAGTAPSPVAARLTVAVTNSTLTYASTGLSVPLAAGKSYEIRAYGQYRTPALTTGIGIRLNASGGLTATGVRTTTRIWNASAPLLVQASALAVNALSTAVAAANTDYAWEVDGHIRVNAAGNLVVEFVTEVNGSLVTIQPDAYLLCTPTS